MEEKDEMKESLQHEEAKEEKTEVPKEIEEENNGVHVVEQNQLLSKDDKEEGTENGGEDSVLNQVHEEGKVGETQQVSLKKQKPGSKETQKAKCTVPQPFSLATDRRMSRGRRGVSEDYKDPEKKLSESVSLNYKGQAQTSLGSERNPELRRRNFTTPRPTTSRNGQIEKVKENGPKVKEKVQVKEAERKKSQANAKEEEYSQIKELKKNSTFKASPLPSFYQQKDLPPKPEVKKIPVTRPKSPVLGHRRSKSITVEPGNNNTEEKNSKSFTRTISSSAKETLNKLLRTTQKSLKNQESTKGNETFLGINQPTFYSNIEGQETVADQSGSVEEFNQDESDLPNAADGISIQQEQHNQHAEAVEPNQRDLESKEQQYIPRRNYQNQRGGGRGGRRGYSNGRGGRSGRSGGGYQNGRNQYYEQPGNYYPRNYYNSRGRGGRSSGGHTYSNNNNNYHNYNGPATHGSHVQVE